MVYIPMQSRSTLGVAIMTGSIASAVLSILGVAAAATWLVSAGRLPAWTLAALLLAGPACAAPVLSVLLLRARRRIEALERSRAAVAEQDGRDALTGLPNRANFERRLAAAIEKSSAAEPVALIAIDVDRFKNVNDTHGHQAGDRLLVEISDRIRAVLRKNDCLARIGGDEFALIMPRATDAGHCAGLAHRILDSMVAALDLGVSQVYATLSLGIAFAPKDGDTAVTLSQAADLALYRAKHDGRGRFAFFDRSMEQKLHLGRTIETDLRRAIDENELTIAYQPLVDGRDGRPVGVEALVRWQHPILGLIPPEDFIALAESRGLIVPLGEWVLRQACQEAKRWPRLRLAVNVSPVQFRQPGFIEQVKSILRSTAMDPARLDLEVTEGVLIQDAEQAEHAMIELRAMGIRLCLDDFGSGYSSMIYLRRFAFDKVKIDRAFLQSFEMSGEGAIILEYIVSLGHALGLSVTAEGVEESEHVAFLRRLGCDELQGYFFAPPLSPKEVDERISLVDWTRAAFETREPVAGLDAA